MTEKYMPYIIASGILLVLIGAAFFFIHLPLANDIQVKQAEYKQKMDQFNLVREKVKQLSKLRSDIQDMQVQTALLQSKIPDNPNISEVVNLLEQFSDDSGVVIMHVGFPGGAQPNPSTGGPNTPIIMTNTCQLTFKGKYPSVIRFMDDLKNATRLFGIRSISFAPTTEAGKELSINLDLVFFNYNGPANPTAAANNG